MLWGEGRPWFRLLPGAGERTLRRVDRAPGKMTFANGSAVVATTADLTGVLQAGEIVSAVNDPQGRAYTILSITASAITLTQTFGEADTGAIAGYVDRSKIWMPETLKTEFAFTPERGDGGALSVQLNDGRVLERATGWRPRVVFWWDSLSRWDFEKLCMVADHRFAGPVEVMPHEDVPQLKWRMRADDDFSPAWPGDKYVGTRIMVGFTGMELITNVPRLASSGQWGPAVW